MYSLVHILWVHSKKIYEKTFALVCQTCYTYATKRLNQEELNYGKIIMCSSDLIREPLILHSSVLPELLGDAATKPLIGT